jgi:DNA invertase Pin-like site-specific DNA recombinase
MAGTSRINREVYVRFCGRLVVKFHRPTRHTNIEVVDVDLGLSGSTLSHREGFKDVIARVTLGEVGIILSYEVTRLARNSVR